MIYDMEEEYKFGQMVLSMKVIGQRVLSMDMDDSFLLTVTSMRVNGRIINVMVKVNLLM